jgi:ribosomal protein S18 acetylase RimI-like enzyme
MGPNRDGGRRPQTEPGPVRSTPAPTTSPPPGPPAEVGVRPGHPDDAPAAAALHTGGISEGFLPLLGPAFLGRLYRRICLEPGSFLLVATSGGAVVGFIAGSDRVGDLYRSFLWRDGLAAASSAWRPLLTRWRRVAETLRHGSSGGAGTGRGSELLAVAVDDRWQGQGVGTRLVEAFLAEVVRRGASAAYVVVGADNDPAVSLYQRSGFASGATFELHPGTRSLVMQWVRPGVAPEPGTPRT